MVIVTVCIAGFGQSQNPDSQLPDAPQPQAQPPQTPPPAPPSEQPTKEEKKPDSKVKRTLKRGKPNCIKIGGMERCKESGGDEDEANDDEQQPAQQPRVPKSQPLPRTSEPNVSSSKDSTEGPFSGAGAEPAGEVRELRPYNPHKADKDVEVGDFYFKRNNYRAAESRYAEALEYMPNHAEATFKLAEAEEKLGKHAQAREHYQKYLKILPEGELAKQAREALTRLDTQAKGVPATSPPAQKHP